MKNSLLLPLLLTILSAVSVVSCDDPPKPPGRGEVTGVTLNETTLKLAVGTAETLIATIIPDNAANKTVKWHSDNPEVATVDETTGEVTAISEGVVKITVTTNNNKKQAACSITVIPGPVKISTAAELAAIAVTEEGLAEEYILMSDITLSNWLPIGNGVKPFTGKLNGNNHTITIISFRSVSDNDRYLGLFGIIGPESEIRDLKVVINQTITKGVGEVRLGSIVGYLNGGIIDNCVADISLRVSDNYSYVGGIAGEVKNRSIIRNCYTMGTINASGSIYNYVGGVVGTISDSSIQSCRTISNIVSHNGRGLAGGIAGIVSDTDIQNCYTMGNISASSTSDDSYAGGIVGRIYDDVIIQSCYTTGNIGVSGGDNGEIYAGGIVAYMHDFGGSCTLRDCYTTGNITSSGNSYNCAGGIAGFAGYPIQNCYAMGNINASGSGGSSHAGGIAGFVGNTVQNTIALNNGITVSGNSFYRQRIGNGDYTTTVFMNNYGSTATIATPAVVWQPNVNGKDGANCSPRPAESWWKDSNNWLSGAGASAWDFTNVWQWDSASGLPKLRNMP